MSAPEFERFVREILTLPHETEWVEFKHNNGDPEMIGERISALSNSAAMLGKGEAYLIWGIEDATKAVVGTSFRPRQAKVGGENLENWLLRALHPALDVRIEEGVVGGREVVLFRIPAAAHTPVRFKESEFIRVGSYTKKLKEFPEKERALWASFSTEPFEKGIAKRNATSDEVLSLIDYPGFFRLLQVPLPDNRAAILERLAAERVIVPGVGDRFEITNLGAILFAARLASFERLARKAVRVIVYRSENRNEAVQEQGEGRGYAVGFEGLLGYVNDVLPQNEQIEVALRRQVRLYPPLAVRELIANALIHQDFSLTGTGPTIEVFSDRMEITNPGQPLIDTLRFIDEPPRSRNEQLAALMCRMNICEERGSGIDKVVSQAELFQLPAPDFRRTPHHTVAVIFSPRDFSKMDRSDRIRACYQHACLWYVSGKPMTNTTLRQRLKIKKENYPMASRIIRDAIKDGLVRQAGGTRKDARYVPFWA